MGAEIDSLEIEMQASAQSANRSLDALVKRLDALTTSLGRVNGNSIVSLSNGVQNLANSMQSMKSVGTADFTRLAKNIAKMGDIDASSLGRAASSLQRFSNSLAKLDTVKVSDNAEQIGILANGIKQLGYKSSTQAIENIPKLATAMKQLMTTISGVPKVSQNLIDMTNALAKLSRTGASSGRAATSLGRALDTYTASTGRASRGTFSLAAAFGKLYATYWLLFRAFNKLGEAIDISSDLTEVQNVVDVTFGNMAYKVEEFAETSIEQFGMSELALKQYASRFQSMGTAMGIDSGLISNANSFLNGMTSGYIGLSDSMSDVSLNLTKLTADMASFYNLEQSDVAEDLESIFTGMTRPLRTYGLDLTEATLKEWAMKNGLDADIDSMTQAQKTMLRYQYVLANTGAAQGDFARTADTWANQTRILKQNFQQLASVIGGTFINALKPLVSALNAAMSHIIAFAETISNALGKIFGWKYESGSGGITTDFEDAADSASDIADSTGTAAKNIEKMQKGIRAFDELKTISTSDSSSSGGSVSGSGASSGSASGGQWVEQESILDSFKSDIDSLYELGEYIGNTLASAMNGINWDSVYQGARNFGTGLANFLNGLISPELFGATGRTIAGALNTAIYAALSFGETFDWHNFGESIASGINNFFSTFDFKALAQTLNTWVDGIEESIKTALKEIGWKDVLNGIGNFLKELEFDTVVALTLLGTPKFLKDGVVFAGTAITKWVKGAFLSKIAGTKLEALAGIGAEMVLPITAVLTISVASVMFIDDIDELLVKKISELIGVDGDDAWAQISKYADVGGGKIRDIDGNVTGEYETGLETIQKWFNNLFREHGGTRKSFDREHGGASIEFEIGVVLSDKDLKDVSDKISSWYTNDISPWFTKEKWQELGNNIKDGISTKWGEFTDWWTSTGFYEWWTNVSSYFAKENWQTFGDNAKNALSTKWNEFSEWWSETGFYSWWNDEVSPWFEKDTWGEFGTNVKSGLSDKWKEFVEWWRGTGFYNWWHNDVESFFTKDKWTWAGIKDGLTDAWNAAVDSIKGVWNNFASWLNDKLTINIDTSSLIGKGISDVLGTSTIKLGNIPAFSVGGFPEDGLFYANHSEIVGKFSNGRTAVANNEQITQGIADAVYPAVYNAVSSAMRNNGGSSDNQPVIKVYVGDRELTDIAIDGINERTRRTGRTPIELA